MADYSRPASGYRFRNGGLKLNAPPDAVGDQKYPLLVNVRSTNDTTLQTRPGMSQLFTSPFNLPITDLRAYSALKTDNTPRILARDSSDNIIMDTSLSPGSLLGGGTSPGAAMLPFRPNQSPNPWMYIANGTDYKKFSAPDSFNVVNEAAVGIIEPQAPPEAGISGQYQSLFLGEPAGFNYSVGGSAAGLLVGSRIEDQVVAVFPDPAGQGMRTLQVTGGFGSLPAAIYLYSSVRFYLFPANHAWNGGFGFPFPLDTSTAMTARQGNSLMFNPIEFNGTGDPNVQPMRWAILDANGAIVGYNIASGFANEQYDAVMLCQLFVPTAGNYTMLINHDDGIIFAIAGASLVSGPHADLFGHIKTAVQGLVFTNTTVAGSNLSGLHQETFVLNFPNPGVYAMEIDYAQWTDNQSMVVRRGDGSIITGGGVQAYQREMSILIDGQVQEVQDVFPPLPQALGIDGIYYLTGPPGKCVVVPTSLSPGSGNAGVSLYDQAVLAGLRRGSLVEIGGEVCLVESVTTGPNGTVCFEVTTAGIHSATESLNGVPAISILGVATPGQQITSPDITFTVATGVGTINLPVAGTNPFVNGNQSFQEEDYIHFSVNVDNLSALTEMKILFDVEDGSFLRNFYYYTIRPSDIAAGVQNTLTQLGVAQIVAQRRVIDEERAAASGNQAQTFSSAQTNPGDSQWSEIFFPVSELTRVGNAQSKSLQNVTAIQFLFNVTGTLNFALNSFSVLGGYAPDVGDSGIPYQYRIRARSSITGVKGNPSPATRYGLSPRRQQVTVRVPPNYSVDPQADVWDVFRFGGSLTSWRFLGYVPIGAGTTTFVDNFGDDAAEAGAELEFDNLEPWPTIDLPLNATATQVTGTTALVTIPAPNNALRLLPGNLVQLGGHNVFHLWNRPVLVSSTSIGGNVILSRANIETSGAGWANCFTVACAGGAVDATSTSQTFGATSQMQVVGPPFSNSLWYYQIVGSTANSATAFVNDFEVFLDPADSIAETFEFDIFQNIGGVQYMFGSQYNLISGRWQIWDALNHVWVNTSITTGLPLGVWNHVRWEVHRSGANMIYDTLTINGVPFTISITLPSGPTGFADAVGVNYQLDIGPSGTTLTETIRNAGFAAYDAFTTVTGTGYLFQFVENAGASFSTPVVITEPLIAKQPLPYMWGPDAEGTVFAVGDPLRPGNISFAKNYAPDAAPDTYNVEITPPSEPLLGGEVLDGVSYVASTERWWRLYAQGTAFLNPQVRTQHYSAVQQAIPRGLAAPFGHCTDGSNIYWWAKDGIYSTDKGSLTDADLYNLFPHEGVAGVTVIYNGVAVTPPDYSHSGTFRLAYGNGYLYANYQDAGGFVRALTLDLKRMAWCVDQYADPVTVTYHVEQQEGSVEVQSGSLYPQLLLGTRAGIVGQQQGNHNDLTAPISCAVATMEWDAGDTRASQQWGDGFLDSLAAGIAPGITAQPMSQAVPTGAPTLVTPSASRVETIVSLGGGSLSRFMGLLTTWTDDFSQQNVPSQLFIYQFSYINKPETIEDRFTDWMNVQPSGQAGWVQGFVLHADTFNTLKGLSVRDSDSLTLHTFTPAVQHNGESIKAYSFDSPFISHMLRFEPTDLVNWRYFDTVIVAEATPEIAETWETQSMSFGFNGYSHIQRIVAAYASGAPVTLTITSYDGTSPAPVVFPSTGGAYQKRLQVLTFNKGQLFHFRMTSPLPFQAYLEDFEIICGDWGRQGSYTNYKSLGGKRGDQARI